MRKLVARFSWVLLVCLVLVQVGWVVFRVISEVVDESAYFNRPSLDNVNVVETRAGLELVADHMRVRLCDFDDAVSDGVIDCDADVDGDGLDAAEELRRLTSDLNRDSDGDGVPDNKDTSPNANSRRVSVESSVVTAVLTQHAREMGYSESGSLLALYRVSYSGCYTSENGDFTFVCATDSEMVLIRRLGVERAFRLEKLLYVPGLLYLMSSRHQCGPRCNDGRYYLVWDAPFVGPTILVGRAA